MLSIFPKRTAHTVDDNLSQKIHTLRWDDHNSSRRFDQVRANLIHFTYLGSENGEHNHGDVDDEECDENIQRIGSIRVNLHGVR